MSPFDLSHSLLGLWHEEWIPPLMHVRLCLWIPLKYLPPLNDQIIKVCRRLSEVGFVNYFGLQRFGSGGAPTHRYGVADVWVWRAPAHKCGGEVSGQAIITDHLLLDFEL
jgi:hypothetical protein